MNLRGLILCELTTFCILKFCLYEKYLPVKYFKTLFLGGALYNFAKIKDYIAIYQRYLNAPFHHPLAFIFGLISSPLLPFFHTITTFITFSKTDLLPYAAVHYRNGFESACRRRNHPVVSKAADQTDHPDHRHPQSIEVRTSSPRFKPSPAALRPNRRIAIAVDLSNESAYAVKWAVENYVRPSDTVTLVHVNSTSVLYGADWGPFASTTTIDPTVSEEERDNFTAAKANHLAQPLAEANVPYKIHIVKDHDMKERLCLEVERLGFSALITGSRGAGVLRKSTKGKLGSVSDYCVQHCSCPVVVVRYNQEKEEEEEEAASDLI
ncbi:universal stress protein PHOS32-like [Sesamum indicum]|uniref:Universal stress protein PHOS32-like n=1 Tax=Sesamum indicum TaxID=4182 RepID=A0A6I9T5K9_SESIN|nr:universal stress protein PHOS32-like [Sesamum indicum]